MGNILGGAGGSSAGGGDFTTQGGQPGGGGGFGGTGGGVLFAPQLPGSIPPNIQNILNTSGGSGGGGGVPGGGGFPGGVDGPAGGGIGGGLGGIGGIPSGGAAFEPNQQPFAPVPGLTPPSGFDPQTGGGDTGILGLGQSLGQNFTVEQTQQQSQIAPQQGGALGASIQAALQLAANQLDPQSQLSTFLGGPGAALPGQGQEFLQGIGTAQQGLLSAEDPSIVQGRIDALGTDIQQFLGEAIGGAGGIGTQGALAGNLGGGRSQVLGGIATRGATDAFARESAAIRESAAGRRLQGLLGGAQAGQLGIQGAQDVFNLGLSPSQAQFSPLLSLGSIIGDPQITQQSLQQKLAQGVESGASFGETASGVGNLLTGITNAAPGVGKLFDQIFS